MDPRDSFELKPGDVLAEKFRIEQVLGVGGMGIVAAAWHLELRTRVALKLLLPSALTEEGAIERFSREANAVSRMRSEFVVRVFDVGTLPNGGPPFIVMEHLEGEDLEALLVARGQLKIEEAVGYLMQACEGTAEAHSLGIVHRDLKPANLFLTRRADGTKVVKVVDFGIAKQHKGSTSATLTAPLVAMGSPQYMSPEQTRAAKDVDASTDVWSLGVCLYEMLTGIPPFDAPSVAEVTAFVLTNDPTPPIARRPEIPPKLSVIIMKCLEKHRRDRFGDVAELAEALEEFAPRAQRGAAARMRLVLGSNMRSEPISSPTPDVPSIRGAEAPAVETPPSAAVAGKRRSVLAIVGVVLLGGAVGSAVAWYAGRPPQASPTTPPSVASATVVTTAPSASEELPPIGLSQTSPAGTARPVSSASPRGSSARRGTHPGKRHGAGIGRVFPDGDPDSDPDPPAPVATASPVVAAPPVVAPPPATTPVVAPPAAPRFALASARVEIGPATNTFGTTASNVNRVIAPVADRMTACYRAALPQMPDPVSGSGVLHVETDDDGVIIVARVGGSVTAPGACIAGSVSGRKVPNVDTGRARADVPLSFKSQ